jgi:hypothetical protein
MIDLIWTVNKNILVMLETELQNSRQYVIVEVNVDLKL